MAPRTRLHLRLGGEERGPRLRLPPLFSLRSMRAYSGGDSGAVNTTAFGALSCAQARGIGHLRFFGWKTVDVTEKLFRTQPILDWLAYGAECADGRVFAANAVPTGLIGCMTEVA